MLDFIKNLCLFFVIAYKFVFNKKFRKESLDVARSENGTVQVVLYWAAAITFIAIVITILYFIFFEISGELYYEPLMVMMYILIALGVSLIVLLLWTGYKDGARRAKNEPAPGERYMKELNERNKLNETMKKLNKCRRELERLDKTIRDL